METKALLTVRETAEALNVSVSAIRSWIFARRLPVVRLGGLVRIKASTIARIQEDGLDAVQS